MNFEISELNRLLTAVRQLLRGNRKYSFIKEWTSGLLPSANLKNIGKNVKMNFLNCFPNTFMLCGIDYEKTL